MEKVKVRKLFFILMFMVITGNVNSKVTYQHVKDIYQRVENISGYHIQLAYDNDPSVNAYSYLGKIYITQGMLDILKTDDEIVLVLGHEIGHFGNQDYRTTNSSLQELRADRDGYYYCKKLKYNNCLGFVKKMIKLYGQEPDDGVHPSWKIRMNKLKNK